MKSNKRTTKGESLVNFDKVVRSKKRNKSNHTMTKEYPVTKSWFLYFSLKDHH